MDIYEENLDALKYNNYDIYEYITKSGNNASNVSIEAARNGEPVVSYGAVYLNSRYNPSAEAEKYMADVINMPDESILTIFGLSNGSYVRDFISKNTRHVYCLVVEPSKDILLEVLRYVDIKDILMDERCRIICCGINDDIFEAWISLHLQSYNIKTNNCITLPKYRELFVDKLDWMMKTLQELYDKQKIQTNTIKRVGALTCRNMLRNMRHFEGCRCVEDLTGRFPEDMPAIVVSAGPSLANNVHLLEQAKGKAFIICTDSAINTVLATGTKPDMIVAVDFAKPVKLFNADNLCEIPFLADIDLNADVLDVVKPKDLFITTENGMTIRGLLNKCGSDIQDIDAGGSVATCAISNLIRWGFKKVILIGQDLAFTGNKIHVGNDDDEEIDLNDKDYEFVEGIHGDMLPVRKDYFQYLRWIEELGRVNKNIEIIDATEGGSKKRNTTIMTLKDAIDKYCRLTYDIQGIIDSVPRLFVGGQKAYITEHLDDMLQGLTYFREKFDTAAKLCDMGKGILESGKYDIDRLKLINEYMDFLDNEYVTSDYVMIVTKYNAEAEEQFAADMYIEEDDDISESIRMYEKSKKYYNMTEEAMAELIDLISTCKEEL